MEDRYRALYQAPETCEPLVQVNFPITADYSKTAQLSDPAKMLSVQLAELHAHRQVGDDCIPTLRAEFGTAQIAAAFGCDIRYLDDSLPACLGPVITDIDKTPTLPSLHSGLTPTVLEFEDYFMKHLPPGTVVQHPDVQSTFNSAHLIRGNDILTDFYDNPKAVSALLSTVTDFMLVWIDAVKRPISNDSEWFYDCNGLWRGGARISNCSMQIISPALYRQYIMEQDERFLAGIGGGGVHYCGANADVLRDFLTLKHITFLQIDSQYHDINAVCQMAPAHLPLMFCDWSTDPCNRAWYQRILDGDIPPKRNIVLSAKAENVEDAKRVYFNLKNALLR